ncbi:MAG: carboxylating nicotinate-nucleotide diphosphorylase [Candidatus Aenigmarchaeota archaeon]|nr:carboxylating nicotinate-nucleotide diphosphorylase [Candidatus Aenigmarchaeota archaeon]
MNKNIQILIKTALKEDIGPGDITTESTLKKDKTIEAHITSNQDGTLCGIDIAKKVFETLDKNITFQKQANDTEKIKANQTIAKLKGSAKKILAGERTALNFLGHLTGIATQTSKYVEQCKNAELLDTRKTTPCLRTLEKYAVKCGGGKNHRMGLYDMILIKDNHIKAAGSIENALMLASKQNITSSGEGGGSRTDTTKHKWGNILYLNKEIELECKTLDEIKEALKAKTPPDIIMLDNMTIPQIKKAIAIINKKTKTEISGGITLNNIKQIDALKPDYISTSKITVSAPHHDYSMNIEI